MRYSYAYMRLVEKYDKEKLSLVMIWYEEQQCCDVKLDGLIENKKMSGVGAFYSHAGRSKRLDMRFIQYHSIKSLKLEMMQISHGGFISVLLCTGLVNIT